jgi:hypothetical protein
MILRVHNSIFTNDCLRQNHLFAERDHRFVELLSRDVKVEVFKPGEIIMKEGTRGNSLYILRRGEVEVLVGSVPVARLRSGSFFGEIALLGVSDRRTATVRATEFSDCRVVQRKYLQRLLKLFPDERAFFEHLARQRVNELKATGPNYRRPTTKSTSEDKHDAGLPVIDDEGAASRPECAALMEQFSRFFGKPYWRTERPGAQVQGCQPCAQPRQVRGGSDLLLLKDRPKLPPLITRTIGVMPSTSAEDNDTDVFLSSLPPDSKGARSRWGSEHAKGKCEDRNEEGRSRYVVRDEGLMQAYGRQMQGRRSPRSPHGEQIVIE